MAQKVKTKVNKNKLFKTVFWLLFIALVSFCTISFFNNTADISRLNAKKASYSKQISAQEAENKKLKAVADSNNKDDYIEKKAREKGYVKEGETVFYDISSSK